MELSTYNVCRIKGEEEPMMEASRRSFHRFIVSSFHRFIASSVPACPSEVRQANRA